ncbi:calcium:sodium antiporter [Aureococcus anophagefferens]|nr:calcium:sodium antiporter [Aureococcus anophagefferens]
MAETCGKARVKVGRYNGAGQVQCDYELVDGTACCGKDFRGTVGFEREGTFVFENTEVGGGADDDFKASAGDWVMHIITLPWKVAFAFVPPTSYGGGWVCFV